MMRVLVIGYGSMGRRRIRLIRSIREKCDIVVVDNKSDRIDQAISDGYQCYKNLDEVLCDQYYCAFVCTSPGNHDEIIIKLLKRKINVFTELNLISRNYDSIIKLAEENNVSVFMSSTKLYNRNIMAIKEIVADIHKPLSYCYHVGQYLPDWHPWENYKDFFVSKKSTNGVREILAIQIPWLIDVFGKIESVSVIRQNCSDLEIEFSDVVIVSIKHVGGSIGVFIADIVSRQATTSLEVIGEDVHVKWGGHYDDLMYYNCQTCKMETISVYQDVVREEGYADVIIENQYYDEVVDFFKCLETGSEPKYSIQKDLYTLSIIDEIEVDKA